MLKQIPVTAVKVGERMRQLDESKVLELMQSFEQVSVINPISVDEDLHLIAGAHRLEAAKNLGWETIEAKIFDEEDLQRELIEIDENLIRNELCYIASAEHITERERILTSLGQRKQRGSNRYTDDPDALSTDDLAIRSGWSNKTYRIRRQIADLSPEARNALRGTEYARRNLNDLLHLVRQSHEVQSRVGQLASEDEKQSLRFHIDTANIEIHTDRDKSQLVAELKEKWGVPLSVMRFDRENHHLSRICRQVTKHTECRVIKGNVVGRDMPNYSGFVDHSLFLLDYFVRDPGSRCLDNFCGKGTNLIAGLWLGMEMHGFDLNPRLIDRIQEVVDEHLPEGDLHLYNEDGIRMQPLEAEEESFDCVISDPPYLNCPDLYTDDPEDLSNMKQEEWEDLMRESFRQYHRLLKRSQVKDKTFYPLMLRMTADPTEEAWKRAMQEAVHHQDQEEHQQSTIHPVIMKMNASRRAETGMVSMDFILARIAAEEGFTLWDRTFNTLAPAAVAVSALRNYDFHYTHKNWETTLIWIKQ
jgi:ParB-like chromosome segregation protein Spo0J/16S rRNA G966 N2-methylase RsmD